jgi:hypothetical protein
MHVLICAKCKTENPEDADFCKKCGQRLFELVGEYHPDADITAVQPTKKADWRPLIVLLVIAVPLLGYFLWNSANESLQSSPTACPIIAQSYLEEVEDVFARWNDARMLASSTSRIALSGPIGQLQAIRREAERLDPPDCARDAQRLMLLYMDADIRAFLAFMSQQDDDEVTRIMESAYVAFESWLTELGKLRLLR